MIMYNFILGTFNLLRFSKMFLKILSLSCYVIILFSCSSKMYLSESNRQSIKSELLNMVETDQIAANPRQGKYKSYNTDEWKAFKDSVFTSHKQKLEIYYKKYGFLGFDKVGKEGSKHFWLLVQHCDEFPDFQKRILKDMDKEVRKENAHSQDFAYLYDRVQINSNKKQKFGTQVEYEFETTGRAFPKNGLVDSVNIDAIRSKYGLSSLKDYLNLMTTMHFEMNKDRYIKMGINSPNLYH